eukprot:1954509-Amphidinium_carterae.1
MRVTSCVKHRAFSQNRCTRSSRMSCWRGHDTSLVCLATTRIASGARRVFFISQVLKAGKATQTEKLRNKISIHISRQTWRPSTDL